MPARAAGKISWKRIAEYVGFCSPFCLPDTVQKNAERLYLNHKLVQGGAEAMGMYLNGSASYFLYRSEFCRPYFVDK